jgi:outer membrane protein assembly factor BamB
VVAFELKTGKELWRTSDDAASYSTPAIGMLDGKLRLACLTREGLLVLDPGTGAIVHQMPFRARLHASVNAATPIISENQLFLSASYGTGAILLDDLGKNLKTVWRSDNALSSHYNTPVKVGDHLYGVHGRQEEQPQLCCVEWKTGTVKWTRPGFGCSALVAIDGLLIASNEAGEFVLLKASPDSYQELGRFSGLSKPVRAMPAVAQGTLFARDGRTLAAWKIAE